MPRSATRQLVRDELIGFARSRVMLVLWIVLPCIALAGFLLLRGRVAVRSAARSCSARRRSAGGQ